MELFNLLSDRLSFIYSLAVCLLHHQKIKCYFCVHNKSMSKLFAVGFPRDFDELQLAQLFAPYGDVDLLTIMRDKVTGMSKGFGFVHMKTEAGADEAIAALNGHAFGDRQMEVRLADGKPVPVQRPVAKPKYVPVRAAGEAPAKKKRPRLSR